MLKTILRLPNSTSTDAARFILGQQTLSSKRAVQRAENLLRIRKLPYDTGLREIHDDGVLDGQSLPFGKFRNDLYSA